RWFVYRPHQSLIILAFIWLVQRWFNPVLMNKKKPILKKSSQVKKFGVRDIRSQTPGLIWHPSRHVRRNREITGLSMDKKSGPVLAIMRINVFYWRAQVHIQKKSIVESRPLLWT